MFQGPRHQALVGVQPAESSVLQEPVTCQGLYPGQAYAPNAAAWWHPVKYTRALLAELLFLMRIADAAGVFHRPGPVPRRGIRPKCSSPGGGGRKGAW